MSVNTSRYYFNEMDWNQYFSSLQLGAREQGVRQGCQTMCHPARQGGELALH